MLQLGRGQPPILAGDDGADAGCCELQLEVLGAVLRQQRNAVAMRDTLLAQQGGNPADPCIQFAVGQRLRIFLDRQRRGIAPHPRAKQLIDRKPSRAADVAPAC